MKIHAAAADAAIQPARGQCNIRFDARYNVPRIGRIVIARGRDAADVAMITSFGTNTLLSFEVWAEEILRAVPVEVTSR